MADKPVVDKKVVLDNLLAEMDSAPQKSSVLDSLSASYDSVAQKQVKPAQETSQLNVDPIRGIISLDPSSQRGIERTRELTKQTGLGIAEGYTGGIPRAIIEKTTGQDLSEYRGNFGGRIIGAMSPGGVVSRAAKGAKITGRPILSALASGAAGGFVAAPEMTSDALDIRSRILQGSVSSLFSGAFERGAKVASVLKESFAASKAAKELSLKLTQLPLTQEFKRPGAIQRLIKMVRSGGNRAIQAEKEATKEIVDNLSGQLADEAEKQSVLVKPKLIEAMREPSRRFGQTLDESIERADILSKAGDKSFSKLTVDDVLSIRDNTIRELTEEGLAEPKIIEQINSLTESLAKEGRQLTEELDFKEVLSLKKRVGDALGASSKSGFKQFNREDVALAVFQRNISEPVKTKLGLEALYKEYADYTTIAKFIYKHFKPKSGEFDISSTKNFLYNLGIGAKKITKQDLKAMAIIEEGTSNKLFPGIGKVTDRLKEIGYDIDFKKAMSKQNIDRVDNFINGKISQLESKLSLQRRLNQKSRVDLELQLNSMRELASASNILKRSGSAAAMAVLQGATTYAFFNLFFKRGMGR